MGKWIRRIKNLITLADNFNEQDLYSWSAGFIYKDGRTEFMKLKNLAKNVTLPDVIAGEVKEGDAPTELKLKRFELVNARDGLALFKESP